MVLTGLRASLNCALDADPCRGRSALPEIEDVGGRGGARAALMFIGTVLGTVLSCAGGDVARNGWRLGS